MMRTVRTRSMSPEQWKTIVLSDRRERIEKIARQHGEGFVADVRRQLKKRDVHAVDVALERIGYRP